jgi:hypothetical protein
MWGMLKGKERAARPRLDTSKENHIKLGGKILTIQALSVDPGED